MQSIPAFKDSASVRDYLIKVLQLDLVGPDPEDEALQNERIQYAPSKWYLTGFLVPAEAPIEQRAQDTEEELDEPSEPIHGADDASTPERGSGKRVFLPSSAGLSVLADPVATRLDVKLTWGDYAPEENLQSEEARQGNSNRRKITSWVRTPHSRNLSIDLGSAIIGQQVPLDVPESGGLKIVYLIRETTVHQVDETKSVRAISLFVVNQRPPAKDDGLQDTAFTFQIRMSITTDRSFIPRFDPRGLEDDDWDDRLADLHYRDVAEYAVGHNVSVRAETTKNLCHRVHTEWMPQAVVERVEPSQIPNVEFGMEALGNLQRAAQAQRALNPLVETYRNWIENQNRDTQKFSGRRREVADELVRRARSAESRIQAGIDLLADPELLEAFSIANRAMAAAARRRIAQEDNRTPSEVNPPAWRPFQLAYILMNLRGVANPTHIDRETVDLLFFPTGGGKTEAYLGLAAFTLVLRRLRNHHPLYRGLSVLMRYTLRLLTLDQLGRAAALVCALELERERMPDRLGTWPFEIGLWVGRAATPNYMGEKGDSSPHTARAKTIKFKGDSRRDPPLPLDRCPWCGTKFNKHSFRLDPNFDTPTDLHVYCARRTCDFSGQRHLPIVAVDEPIYERLPAFMIATVDKFASMPWTGETARFFRGLDPNNPRPPDLIIQDELHLISGPLGTMVGLYETAIDHLCQSQIDGKAVRPKIIASTATVRLAQKQIRALFGRSTVEVFPPPGIDRRNSFFAEQVPQTQKNPRLYLGISAQGRGPKVVFLRSMITLMAAAQAAWDASMRSDQINPADPYMTVVAYFNALRELGSARRITEDEIRSRLLKYSDRKRLDLPSSLFANRKIGLEPVELTSRVSTALVAEAKRKLSLNFDDKDHVDVALATNMISVGLDITRLGLMVVSGQPKSTSEYIQATSRVGRDSERPGLVVTLLNIHRPRDRSHYEHFSAWHESFYRGVEVTSVTPFSSRALDRGLPAVTVALARLRIPELTPMLAASDIEGFSEQTSELAKVVGERARNHSGKDAEDITEYVRNRTQSLIDDWAKLAHKAGQDGMTFGYTRQGKGVNTPLLREMIDPGRNQLNQQQLQFRAPRSLRDVEPGVLLAIHPPTDEK